MMVCAAIALLFVPPLLPVTFAVSWQGERAQWGSWEYGRVCCVLFFVALG